MWLTSIIGFRRSCSLLKPPVGLIRWSPLVSNGNNRIAHCFISNIQLLLLRWIKIDDGLIVVVVVIGGYWYCTYLYLLQIVFGFLYVAAVCLASYPFHPRNQKNPSLLPLSPVFAQAARSSPLLCYVMLHSTIPSVPSKKIFRIKSSSKHTALVPAWIYPSGYFFGDLFIQYYSLCKSLQDWFYVEYSCLNDCITFFSHL